MRALLGIDDLIVRAEITDVQMEYARGIDARAWDRYRAIFADEVAFDFSSWSGIDQLMRADDWVARVRGNLSGFDATQHVLTNLQFEPDSAGMNCRVQMMAIHVLIEGGAPQFQVIGGYYSNHFRRFDDGWRIDRCQLNVTWEKGDRALFARAKERWERMQGDIA